MRNVFQTSTGQSGAIAAFAGFVIAITPFVFNIAENHTEGKTKDDLQNTEQIILIVAGLFAFGGGSFAIAGRANAKDKVFSPRWMPGHNKEDLEVVDPTLSNSPVVKN